MLTNHELSQLSAARELAFCMLGIVLAVKQVDMLMVRLGVGRA